MLMPVMPWLDPQQPASASSHGLLLGQASWVIATAVTLALGGAAFLGTGELVTTAYSLDDQFFYFQIARNVASGNGFTFDGVHETNGFHPLWLFMLVPVFGLVPGDDAPLRVVIAVEVALLAAAAVVVFRVLRARLGEPPALVAALLLVGQPGSTTVFGVGMESSLLLLLLVLVWQRWLAKAQEEVVRPQQWLGLGTLCAFALLARLEAVLVLPVILVLARRRLLAHLKGAVALVAPTVLCAASYLTWNRLAFDTWLPISGMVKAEWARAQWVVPASPTHHLAAALRLPWFGEGLIHRVFGIPSLSAHSAMVYLALLGVILAGVWGLRRHLLLAVTSAGATLLLLSCALIVLVDKWVLFQVPVGARVPIFLVTSVLGGALIRRTPGLARIAAAVLFGACAVQAPLTLWRARDASEHTAHYVIPAAKWLRDNMANSDRLGTSVYGGMLGYFSGRHVVVLDGVVNDLGFFRRVVRNGDLEGYLRDEGIAWLAGPGCGPRPSFSAALRREGRFSDEIERLGAEFSLAAGFYQSPNGCPGYALWRATRR